MDIKDIYELWDRFEGSTALELDVEVGGGRLHLRRESQNVNAAGNAVSLHDMNYPGDSPAADAKNKNIKISSEDFSESESDEDARVEEKEIRAPLVGTFYRSAEPNGTPFVKVGQKVKKGDRLCIIEAMKLMNDVTADRDGEILKVSADDGSLVEYGQTLFILK